ncbi:MAG: DUF1878 family protein [Bacillota bacterium]|nr:MULTISPECIES: DUF1878 family protein [Bacillaceae]MCC2251928.1 YhaI family protein [Virgibacillus sp. AGTR]MDY7044920.1 DUF1878 family protein [Virgibacillus sp. M23]WBX80053.1 DUF1878 family protein [Virgibacillus salarius]
MGTFNEAETAAFHLQLLSKIIDMDEYPFTKLVIERNLTREEFAILMERLEKLNEQYEAQKEEGLIHFSSLLIHFAGMLTEKLEPDSTINALQREGFYPSLMNEFIRIIKQNNKG